MSSTNKGNYIFCHDCKYHIKKQFDASSRKYPCYYSHSIIRDKVKYEKDFITCIKYEKTK
jgi:hypothetical protein